MSRRNLISILLLALAALPLVAGEMTVTGPVSGFVFDSQQRAIRPVMGILGAAYLGDPVAPGVDFASVAPSGKVALAVSGGRLFLVMGFGVGELRWIDLGAAMDGLDRAAWNADSTAAVVASSTAGRVQRWSHLDATPAASDPTVLDGPILALAIDAAGENIVAGVDGNGVYFVAGGAVRQLSRLDKPAAIALAAGDLFTANRTTNEVLVIHDFANGGDATIFANEAMGVTDPVGLALSADQRSLIVAGGSAKRLTVFDLAGASAPGQVDLDFQPSRAERLSDKSLYLLNDGVKDPLQVLDAGPSMSVYFVPAGTTEE